MPLAIPASAIVNVTPSVIGAGGSGLDLIGLILTNNARLPLGNVSSFPSLAAVQSYFGVTSHEAQMAAYYFLGFDNSNKKPGALLFSGYNTVAVGAWTRGVMIIGSTLTILQGLSGSLSITIDGATKTAASISLSGATSFSNAAQIIQTALGISGPPGASVTGAIAGTTLTVSAVASGTLAVGQVLSGGSISAGTTITALGSGTGGTGTYTVSNSQTVSSTTITTTAPAVSYDSQSGAFSIFSGTTGTASTIGYASGSLAPFLGLPQSEGAVLSQGAAPSVPAVAMAAIVRQTTNWASFTTSFDPDGGSGNAQKIAFAQWTNAAANQYAYVMWDSDITATQAGNTTSAGAQIQALSMAGTIPIYQPSDLFHAPFVMGAIASIDFTETAGRTTLAFRGQTGLAPGVVDQTTAANLIANGYNFVGNYDTANDSFTFFYPGSVSGPFDWADSYINQIWLNNQLQLAMLTMLTETKAVPYNSDGIAFIRAAAQDPINQALNFGAIVPGVALSTLQAQEVNTAAGLKIDDTLGTTGYYLQVLNAIAQVRGLRQSPPCTLWYTDGGSVQQLNLASVEVQ